MKIAELALAFIFTVIYIWVTVAQRNQIKALKSTEDSMKKAHEMMMNYAQIFEPEKIREFVKMGEETAMSKASNFVADDEKVKKLAYEATDEQIESLAKIYKQAKGDEFIELLNMVRMFVYQNRNNEKNLKLILNQLPKTRRLFNDLIDVNNNDD